MVVEQVVRRFKFNRCIHWEKGTGGRYIGLLNPLFDIGVFIIPWVKNDGDRGFVQWLVFRFGWYPVPPTSRSEISPYGRKMLKETFERGGETNDR